MVLSLHWFCYAEVCRKEMNYHQRPFAIFTSPADVER